MLPERADLRGFTFRRGGKTFAAVWHPSGTGACTVALRPDQIDAMKTPDGIACRLPQKYACAVPLVRRLRILDWAGEISI